MFTKDDLVAILKAVGGAEDGVDLDRAHPGVPLADLGYDSLALLEIQSQIKLRHGIVVPDDSITASMSLTETADRVHSLAGVQS
jgi:act minimal PKS acyl carrier protein